MGIKAAVVRQKIWPFVREDIQPDQARANRGDGACGRQLTRRRPRSLAERNAGTSGGV